MISVHLVEVVFNVWKSWSGGLNKACEDLFEGCIRLFEFFLGACHFAKYDWSVCFSCRDFVYNFSIDHRFKLQESLLNLLGTWIPLLLYNLQRLVCLLHLLWNHLQILHKTRCPHHKVIIHLVNHRYENLSIISNRLSECVQVHIHELAELVHPFV